LFPIPWHIPAGSTIVSSNEIEFSGGRVQPGIPRSRREPESIMAPNGALDPLILDLLEWIAREPRSHAEVIEVWRTSCPRLTVWEDAVDRGFAVREHSQGRDVLIRLTADGRDFLREHGRIILVVR
jgi:hypothetical protein